MLLNKIISENLHSLFIEHGLEMTYQSINNVQYESQELVIRLSHNPRENTNTLWVRRKYFNEVEIDNRVMREHFNSNLELSNLPQETFVNNLLLFFMGDGEKLLEGNEHAFVRLMKFYKQRSSDYTANLIEQQNLEAANKAWDDGNYVEVIKYLEKVNKANLSASLKQKYKIARKKLGN